MVILLFLNGNELYWPVLTLHFVLSRGSPSPWTDQTSSLGQLHTSSKSPAAPFSARYSTGYAGFLAWLSGRPFCCLPGFGSSEWSTCWEEACSVEVHWACEDRPHCLLGSWAAVERDFLCRWWPVRLGGVEWAGLGRAQAASTSIYKCEVLIIIIMKITWYTCTVDLEIFV